MKGTGSATAIGAAMLKAAHQLIDGDDKLLTDPVILKLLGAEAKDHILETSHNFFAPAPMALRTHIVLRSRYAEDCLILGAGLDTFAYRQPDWARNIKIVEADHPASQADKLQRLNNAGIAVPGNLSFVKVDLELDDLTQAFAKSALNFNKPVFTACLGVLIYLTQNSIDKIFRFLGGFAAGSEFVFTASQKRDDTWANATAEKAATAGEPWITYFEPEELIKQLKDCGFSEAAFLTLEETERLYFTNHQIHLPLPTRNGIVRAVI
jgi:methyltransferase (TIGR00027 family)